MKVTPITFINHASTILGSTKKQKEINKHKVITDLRNKGKTKKEEAWAS